ncbi:MAG: hypothetical protein HQ541_13840 [Mariniphaga sp.]|nr:hypothetical protein [Mariniphaga sp.]
MKTRKLGAILTLTGLTIVFAACNEGVYDVEVSFAFAGEIKSAESVVAPGVVALLREL